MENINRLADEIREIVTANGWTIVRRTDWISNPNKVACMLALIHSEIVEAHDEVLDLDNDTEKLAAEFADIQIRILDLTGGLTEDFAFYVREVSETYVSDDVNRAFNTLHKITTIALEAFRVGDIEEFFKALALLFSIIEDYAANTFHIDMAEAVPAKIDVNRHRSYRHGGKIV